MVNDAYLRQEVKMDVVSDEISEQVVAEMEPQQEGETDLAKTRPAPGNDTMQTGSPGLVPEPPTLGQESAKGPGVGQVPEQPEQTPEPPAETIEPPTPAPKRVRKVRVAPKEAAPQHTPDPDYWRSRLQEHRGNQRAAKSERYGNLRIM